MTYNFYRNNDKIVKPTNLEYSNIENQYKLYDLLNKCWSKETCAPRLRDKWGDDNKTCGQCSITAFLVQDIFGGEVYGIDTPSGTHCFNKIGDIIFDLTSEQFGTNPKLKYILDNPQTRETHFLKQEKYERYLFLKNKLKSNL